MQFLKLTEKNESRHIFIAAHHITAVTVGSEGETCVHVIGGDSFVVEESAYSVYSDIRED